MLTGLGHIVLCGFTGAGKSSVGALLAKTLERRFVDMNPLLEPLEGGHAANTGPLDLAGRGGDAFCHAEAALVMQLADDPTACVIASSSGMVLSAKNRAAFSSRGHQLVHLQVGVETVVERLRRDGTRQHVEAADQRVLLARAFEAHHPVYAVLPIQIYTEDRTESQVAEAVIRAFVVPE